ncbi:MAG: glycosyltransferase, partial [Candidatus Glassbacteria bacterium]
EEMATTVAEVYHNLSAEEQAKCSIFAGNYGEAGAIDFFGRAHGLPNAISGHNNYWLWGPGESTPEVVIIFGVEFGEFESYFESCEKAAVIGHEYARSFETDLAVWVCRGIRMPISEIWPEVRIFI